MSRFYDQRASASNGWFGIAAALHAAERNFVRPLLAWHQKRATYRELMALDDRQLADIGVSRSDLDIVSFVPGRPPSNRV
jgi:uncharacterized protein YjiS (DUF1127 family)